MSQKRTSPKFRICRDDSDKYPYYIERKNSWFFGWRRYASFFFDLQDAEEWLERDKKLKSLKGVVKYV